MDSRRSHSNLAALCVAISAALFFLGSGLAPIWECTWLAAIPVLWISSRVSGKQAFFLGAAAYALGGLNEWSYARQVLPTWLLPQSCCLPHVCAGWVWCCFEEGFCGEESGRRWWCCRRSG